MRKNIEISFDKDEDLLSIFVSDKKSKFSFDIELPKGDIVVDFGFKGEVVGLEFFNASAYFPLLKSVKEINKLKGNFNVQYGANWAEIHYELSIHGMKEKISDRLISPYNRKLIVGH